MAQVEDIFLPDELYYDRKEHLWARLEEGRVRVGLDMFGQKAAGHGSYLHDRRRRSVVNKNRGAGKLIEGLLDSLKIIIRAFAGKPASAHAPGIYFRLGTN